MVTDETKRAATNPTITPRSGHTISRDNISPNALKVLYRLKNAGYQGYLVGGGVRDLLLGREPKDFDVGTNAHPEQVRQLFRNCRLIGRRFRLAHVLFGNEVVEVATFRARHDGEAGDEDEDADLRIENGRILRDNVYGGIEDDAWRRDFTVNALYYNIDDFSVEDYVGGMDDLRAGTLRVIGDPAQRYREDPVRMLRAVRFAAKLGFRIHPDSEAPLAELGHLLLEIPPARLYEETLKLFLGGSALPTFELLRHYGLFGHLFPLTEAALAEESDGFPPVLLTRALENTDARVNAGKPVTPAFMFAALLWSPMRRRAMRLQQSEELSDLQAMQVAGNQTVTEQAGHISIPKRFSLPMREIWTLQPRFAFRTGARPLRLASHPRFRAAYDFLLLRGEAGEVDTELCTWWTEFQDKAPTDREGMVRGDAAKKKRRRRRRRPATAAEAGD